jgi:hypothetical protein
MELKTKKGLIREALRCYKDAERGLPVIRSRISESDRSLSWLQSYASERLVYSQTLRASQACLSLRTTTHNVNIDVEELDHQHRQNIQALKEMRKCNSRLEKKLDQERSLLKSVALEYGSLIDTVSKMTSKENIVQNSYLHRNPEKFSRKTIVGIKNSEVHAPSSFIIRSQSFGYRGTLNELGLENKSDVHTLLNIKSNNCSSFRDRGPLKELNPFQAVKQDKKSFEFSIRNTLNDACIDIYSTDELMRAISLLNIHISELQMRIFKKKKSGKYSNFKVAVFSRMELESEFIRLTEFENTLRIQKAAFVSSEIQNLKVSNLILEKELDEFQQLTELIDLSISEFEREIFERSKFIDFKDAANLQIFEQNTSIRNEVLSSVAEIEALQGKITMLA